MHNLERLVLDVENKIKKIELEQDNLLKEQKIKKLYRLKNKIRILFENNLVALTNALDYIDENKISDEEAIEIILGLNDEPQHYKVYKNMRDLR